MPLSVVAIIPALDEEATIASVVASLPRDLVAQVIVVDNGSRDATAERAASAGAIVVSEPRRGYGQACLAGLDHAARLLPQVVLFVDGDGSDDPADLPALLEPIASGRADFVVGSRARGERETGALTPQARVGNWIATTWIRVLTGVRFSDLGPFRAIRWEALLSLGLDDRDYGWTVEMQWKAARRGLRNAEVPVRYRRRRGGSSKVAGSIRGTIGASVKILSCLARYTFER